MRIGPRRLFHTLLPIATIASLGGCLASCSLAPLVGKDISRYQVAGGESTDRQIFDNILLAKDREPIHFEQLTQIHGSVSATGALGASIAFGPSAPTTSQTIAPSVTYTEAPSFDIGTLDDQSFWRGIATQPISAEAINGLVRSAILPPTIAFLLFFSEIDIPEEFPISIEGSYPGEGAFVVTGRKLILNGPQLAHSDLVYSYMSASQGRPTRDNQDRPWWGYFSYVNHVFGGRNSFFYVHPYREYNPVISIPTSGSTMSTKDMLSAVKDLLSADASKWAIELPTGGLAQKRRAATASRLFSITQKYAFCLHRHQQDMLLGFPNDSAPSGRFQGPADGVCTADRVVVAPEQPAGKPLPYPIFRVRSVYAIIQYLGNVLRWQEENPNQCISARYSISAPGCMGDVLFRVNAPQQMPVVEVLHHGRYFYLSERPQLPANPAGPAFCVPETMACDHSLQVLAALEVLLNLNKTAQAIPQTPTVRTVP